MVSWGCIFGPVLFLGLVQLLNAADLTQRHDPQGPLQVRLDYALASRDKRNWEGAHQWVFSSHLTFKEEVKTITNRQLAAIAADAHREMGVDMLQYSPKLRNGQPQALPRAMTIMAFGNEIILTSSQKGSATFINEVADSPVRQKLELCMLFWQDFVATGDTQDSMLDHKNRRSCGEIMALHQYWLRHDQDVSQLQPKARLTTVHEMNGVIKTIPPCGTDRDDTWGCDFLMTELFGKESIVDYFESDVTTEAYSLDQLAGGVVSKDQIELCG